MIELRGLSIAPGGDLRAACAKKLRVSEDEIREIRLLRRSVDARKKNDVRLVISAAVALRSGEARLHGRFPAYTPAPLPEIPRLEHAPRRRPVVCGAGPAGLFAALTLARAGAAPILLERGAPVEERQADVDRFHETRTLDPESNVQFGEGGAGAFSDGKLSSGINDVRARQVLRELAAAGAPEEILWQAHPHVGTDHLPGVVRNLRQELLSLGCEIRFRTQLTDLETDAGTLCAVRVRQGGAEEKIETDALILAAGHSARELPERLLALEIPLQQKPFSMGVRCEHPQTLIDRAQYGDFAGHPALGAAEYRLSAHLPSGRGVYTFCMCPGGSVVAAASEEGLLVVNGMSRFARDGANANAALLCDVRPEDFGSAHPLAGVEMQRRWERAAFLAGGENWRAPAQRMEDFLAGTASAGPGSVTPTYPLGVAWGTLDGTLPAFVLESLREAVPLLDRKLHGYACPDAVLTGVETRSSSPVRILRDGSGQSALRGLFPCGEGAGYAGGILSAAVDGVRQAEAVLAMLMRE